MVRSRGPQVSLRTGFQGHLGHDSTIREERADAAVPPHLRRARLRVAPTGSTVARRAVTRETEAPPPAPWSADAVPWHRAYPAGVPTSYPYPDVGLARLLDDAATDFPDAVAIVYRRYRLSYRKLADHTDRLATALLGLGARRGDHIAFVLPDCPPLVIGVFAAWRIGATVSVHRRDAPALDASAARFVVALDRWYPSIAPSLDAAGPDATVVLAARHDYYPFPANVLASARHRSSRRAGRSGAGRAHRFADLVRRTSPSSPSSERPADAVALWRPTGAALTQRQLVVNSFQLRLWMPDVVAGDERVLLSAPLTSTLGVVWLAWAVLSAATMTLCDERRPGARPRAALRARPTVLPFDVDLARELLRSVTRRSRLASVRIAVAAQALSPELRGRMEAVTDKGRIRRVWGVDGMLTHADPVYGRADPQTVGLPLPDTDVVLADPRDRTAAVGVGRRGRLWIRGPQLPSDAWVDTRLEATLNADGYLAVHTTHDSDGTPAA